MISCVAKYVFITCLIILFTAGVPEELLIAELPLGIDLGQPIDFLLIEHAYFGDYLHELLADNRQFYFPLVGKLLEILLQPAHRFFQQLPTSISNILIILRALVDESLKLGQTLLIT